MADKRERASVRITDFQGIVEADVQDIPPGASRMQVNVASRRMGLLQSRKGFLPVAFENTVIVTDLT